MPEQTRDIAAGLALEVRDQHGAPRRLADLRGHNLVVYFYPMDDTPGCTIEGREFRELLEQFEAFDTSVVGVSTDSVERHRAFAEKHDFRFTLLADTDGELALAFGVMGEKRAERSTFIFDHDLHLRKEFREVTPRGHAAAVLNFVRSLVESHRMLGG